MSIKTFYCKNEKSLDEKEEFTNFGDILTPYILEKFGISIVYEKELPELYGIGSILQQVPDNYSGLIWTTGLIHHSFTKVLHITPLAVRGKLTRNQIICNNKEKIVIGDGGLLLERIYPRRSEPTKLLGIFPHYSDIVNMRYDPIENWEIFKNDDVILIDPRDNIEKILDNVLLCKNIVSSSLHGIITCDSYNIPHGVIKCGQTSIAIHNMQQSFKFKDYYSAFDMDFKDPINVDSKTTLENYLNICSIIEKSKIEKIKDELISTIKVLKRILV